MAGAKIERKCLAHFIDSEFNVDPTKANATFNYVRLGQDLEAFAMEMNPQVETRKNILGEQNVVHNGYETSSAVDTFYAYEGEPLFERLAEIANERLTGDDCRTSRVDALFHLDESKNLVCDWAYREDCWVIPQSIGGDTSGVQIPFQILDAGNRVAGTATYDKSKKTCTFTPTN